MTFTTTAGFSSPSSRISTELEGITCSGVSPTLQPRRNSRRNFQRRGGIITRPLSRLRDVCRQWDFLISGLLAGAAVSLTRHVLAVAISGAKAESKTEQKDNCKIGHRPHF